MLVIALHRHSALELVVQDGQRSLQALHDIDILQRGLVHVRVFLDRTDQVRDSRRAALDFVQQVRDLDGSGNPHQGGAGGCGVEGGKQAIPALPA